MNEREIRVVNKPLELRAGVDGKPPVVEGYAALYDSPADLGWYTEVVRKGAFTRSLKENPDVMMLMEHEGAPIARTSSGTMTIKEDSTGLYFRAELDSQDPDAQRVIRKVARGDIRSMSFAFSTVSDKWSMMNGKDHRELLDVNLYEISAVGAAAYPETSIAMRSKKQASQDVEVLRLRLQIAKEQ